ncbi:Crp/Fnr family transcriptional regulator [Flavisphingomonas formosensis]|uniref:Crp/Fnr family transcriptional regulator n=1 Tax=Flavisphingomonas formosensis TaxID=861534 RepID=UPI0012FBEC98|nr:Crp/Fnr family transcriptional regulator [Sphingomonas formosensis]
MLNQASFDGVTSVFRPQQYLARQGEEQERILLLTEGWAYRFHLLSDGRRQITALFVPGDWCELGWMQGEPADQPVIALTNVRATAVPCWLILRKCERQREVCSAFWSKMVAQIRRQTDWIVTLGCRSAIERLSHLFCELHLRLGASGLAFGEQFAMPLTQIDIADITGLTTVHVNRTLREMRLRGLVELQSKWLRIHNLAELRQTALFELSPRRCSMPRTRGCE